MASYPRTHTRHRPDSINNLIKFEFPSWVYFGPVPQGGPGSPSPRPQPKPPCYSWIPGNPVHPAQAYESWGKVAPETKLEVVASWSLHKSGLVYCHSRHVELTVSDRPDLNCGATNILQNQISGATGVHWNHWRTLAMHCWFCVNLE